MMELCRGSGLFAREGTPCRARLSSKERGDVRTPQRVDRLGADQGDTTDAGQADKERPDSARRWFKARAPHYQIHFSGALRVMINAWP
jgi:hypothetical protein